MVNTTKPLLTKTCPKCSGRTYIQQPFTNQTSFDYIRYVCDLCGGSGKVLDE